MADVLLVRRGQAQLFEAVPGGLGRQNRRRQLAMVASPHDALDAPQRQPAGRFGALPGFVDDREVEAPFAEQFVIHAGQRRTEHRGLVEDGLHGLGFQPSGVGDQRPRILTQPLLLPGLGLGSGPLAGLTKQRERLAQQLPREPAVVVFLDEQVERVGA